MKNSKSDTVCKAHAKPNIQFESQSLTSFAGLTVLQPVLEKIGLKDRISACFGKTSNSKIYNYSTLFLQFIMHFMLGYRELRHAEYYKDDPLVKRILKLKNLPDPSTLSRMLKGANKDSVTKLREALKNMVLERLEKMEPARLTIDFDGSVQSTTRRAEGTAVGFNKKKKGARSYYPLFCTIAQTMQVFDFHHRPGNVHDSNGARVFIIACIDAIKAVCPRTKIEVRMDSAFFSDDIITALEAEGIEFTVSVPFERFVELKAKIEGRKRWKRLDSMISFFEQDWKPQKWDSCFRFIFIRTKSKKQQKGPIQLDLFVPYVYGYDFKVIITNKTMKAKRITKYHEGRGSQESIFGELKSHCHQGYIPVRSLYGNQTYLLAGLFAYNLIREFQMQTTNPIRGTNSKRASLWTFEKVATVRNTILCRAGRFTRPQGKLTLTISANRSVKQKITNLLEKVGYPGMVAA
jgi:hypothetical protein